MFYQRFPTHPLETTSYETGASPIKCFLSRREAPGGLRGRGAKCVTCYGVSLCLDGLCFTFALFAFTVKGIAARAGARSDIGLSLVLDSVEIGKGEALLIGVALLVGEGHVSHVTFCFAFLCFTLLRLALH